jgi:gliding motility-associated-like protein
MAVNFSPGTWPFDISISKFNPTGTGLLYATYYGGSLNEQPHSIIVNGNNELYVVGRTNSANFPTTAGAYDQTQNGGYDIIVGRFNSVGNLLGSTFVGGTGDDCVSINIDWSIYTSLKYNYTDDGRSEIVLDNNSNVYIAANTRSTNFPTTVNAYKAGAAIGGTQDAVVIKLNNTLSTLMYSTLLGGTGDDAAYGIKLDNSNNIYVTGGTTSNNFPTTAGVLHTTYQGGVADAFVSVFDPTLANAAQLLRSTYLGTAAFDQSYLIEIDASGDVYVYGQTKGAYPVSAGVYSNANSGQFIHKINGLLTTTIFSTVIGKGGLTPNISPTAFLVDSCQTIYIAGWGRGCTLDNTLDCSNSACVGLPLTANAMQSTTDGVDFYFAVLAPDAKALWYATFFGENTPGTPQDHVDGGTSRFDKRGVIYEACCASCGGTQAFPTKPGSYSTTNQGAVPPNGYGITGNNCNEAAVKMDVAVKPLAVAALTGPANGCAPFTVNFNNSGSSATDFIWDFGDGGVSFIASPSHVYTVPGTYTITLYAIDSIGICGFVDTALVAIKVGAHPVLSATGTNISCPPGLGSATVAVTPTGAMPPLTYAWTPSGGNTTIASGLGAGCYTVTVSDALGCSSTKSVCITQAPPLALATAATGALCGLANGSATVTVTGGVPNYTYSWQPSGKTTSAATGLLTGNYTITVTDSKGCTSQKVVTVPVSGGPTVTVTQLAPILCAGGNTGTASASIAGGTPPYTYAWTPIGGSGPVATGLTAGTYNVLVTDKNGCSGPGTITIGEPPALSATITATNVTCFNLNNGTATAIVSGGTPGYTYNWGTIPIQISQTASGLGTGTYTLLITDSNGCTSIQSTPSVTQPVALVVTATTSGSSCGTSANGGASATVTNGTAPYSYVWMPGGQTSPSITNIAGGTYTVVVTDANGCTQSTTATLVTSIKPFAEFTSKPIISCDGVSIQFKDSSQNALTWSWNFAGLGTSSSQNPSFPFPYNGNYNVTLIVTNPPCSDTVSHMISIGDLGSSTLVKEANVFSPNNDGENDCFHPALINPATGLPDEVLLPCTYLEVFDRWGVKMFESLGANGTNCWDGNNRNDSKPAIDGTYFYISTLGKTKIKGYVTLVRHK